MKNIILANITWNPREWKSALVDPRSGFKYAKKYPGHESLNFKFDKDGIDTRKYIHGYVQWSKRPKDFSDDGLIIFFTKDTDTNRGKIVGLYGKSKIIDYQDFHHKGFKGNKYAINIKAEKDFSILFPVYLKAEQYKENGSRLVPQANFTYKDEDFAKTVILDEIIELQKSEGYEKELVILKNIYEYYFGKLNKTYGITSKNPKNSANTKTSETDAGSALGTATPKQRDSIHTVYERDSKINEKVKQLADGICDLCKNEAPFRDSKGRPYLECHHIDWLSEKGSDKLDNVAALCPNCHRKMHVVDNERDKAKLKKIASRRK